MPAARRVRAAGRLYGIGFAAIVEPSISRIWATSRPCFPPGSGREAGPEGRARKPLRRWRSTRSAGCRWSSIRCRRARAPHRRGAGNRRCLWLEAGHGAGLRRRWIPGGMPGRSRRAIIRAASPGRPPGPRYLAANRLRDRLARIAAAAQLNLRADEVLICRRTCFRGHEPGKFAEFFAIGGDQPLVARITPDSDTAALRETVFWSPTGLEPPNDSDEINSSAAYGFVVRFLRRRDRPRYGRGVHRPICQPARCRPDLEPHPVRRPGARRFAMAIGAALHERFVYDDSGSFLSGSFADYAVPTAEMVPGLVILHRETPSPVTPLGAKGVAEGNSMSTPVCIANAVADALAVADLELPLTRAAHAAIADVSRCLTAMFDAARSLHTAPERRPDEPAALRADPARADHQPMRSRSRDAPAKPEPGKAEPAKGRDDPNDRSELMSDAARRVPDAAPREAARPDGLDGFGSRSMRRANGSTSSSTGRRSTSSR